MGIVSRFDPVSRNAQNIPLVVVVLLIKRLHEADSQLNGDNSPLLHNLFLVCTQSVPIPGPPWVTSLYLFQPKLLSYNPGDKTFSEVLSRNQFANTLEGFRSASRILGSFHCVIIGCPNV